MTITYLGENHAPATNTKGARSYTRTFRLTTSAKTERAYHVGSHASLPVIGEVHPDDAGAWCTTLNVDPSDPWKGWTVTAEYSTERELAEDPTADPAEITWGYEQFQKPAVTNYAGQAIVNSAGDPFDPPIMIDDSRPYVTISKNLASVPVWIMTYQDAVNSSSFVVDGVTVGAGLAKMQNITVTRGQSRNGISFRTVTFSIHLQKQGWQSRQLDAGFREVTYSGELQNIRNPGDDELPAAPVPLNGSGMALENPSPSTAQYRVDVVYEAKDFSALPLT
jgi:hypothetical protein